MLPAPHRLQLHSGPFFSPQGRAAHHRNQCGALSSPSQSWPALILELGRILSKARMGHERDLHSPSLNGPQGTAPPGYIQRLWAYHRQGDPRSFATRSLKLLCRIGRPSDYPLERRESTEWEMTASELHLSQSCWHPRPLGCPSGCRFLGLTQLLCTEGVEGEPQHAGKPAPHCSPEGAKSSSSQGSTPALLLPPGMALHWEAPLIIDFSLDGWPRVRG